MQNFIISHVLLNSMEKKKSLLLFLSLIVAFVLILTFVSANVIIKSVPVQSRWVADGTTEYRMDVYLDTTSEPLEIITGAEWEIAVPSFLTVTRAELPAQNDFFEGFSMAPGWNRVDSTVSGGELTDNVRLVDLTINGFNYGPSNREGILGSYWFTVNTNAPLGVTNFGLNGLYVYDGNADPLATTIEDIPFNIISPPFYADSSKILNRIFKGNNFMFSPDENNKPWFIGAIIVIVLIIVVIILHVKHKHRR